MTNEFRSLWGERGSRPPDDMTTTRRQLLNHVEIEPGPAGLDKVSYATCEDVRSVSEGRLVHRLGRVESPVVHAVDTILRHLLEL